LSNWYKLDLKDYPAAIQAGKAALETGDSIPPLGYFVIASGYAGLGEQEPAFEWLNTAIENGWTAINFTTEKPEFRPWHDRQEWHNALKRIKGE